MRFAGLIISAMAAAILFAGCTPRDDQSIRIVGSSTVYPFSRTVAERYAIKSDGAAPVIEVTGTGAGFKRFCSGPHVADISNASRQIKSSEVDLCADNSVGPVLEFMFGYDGIVAATAPENPLSNLTLLQLYLGLARDIPDESGAFAPNPHKRWSDVDPALPDMPILVHGPPPTSGTRDAFVELGMQGGAKAHPVMAQLRKDDEKLFASRASAIREDGLWIDEGENDNAIIQIIRQSDHAIGVFGFSFFDQNKDLVSGLSLGGVSPNFQSIANQQYPLARSLYFYADSQLIGGRPDVQEYIGEFLSEAAIGEFGYLAEKGLIALSEAEQRDIRDRALDLIGGDDTAKDSGS